MSKQIDVLVDTHLYFGKTKNNADLVDKLKDQYTRSNPDFFKKKRMNFWVGDTPKTISSWHEAGHLFFLPRGTLVQVKKVARSLGYSLKVIDRTVRHSKINLSFRDNKKLRPDQLPAVQFLADKGNALVRGDCGVGKTVVLLGAIRQIAQPTIVIVNSNALLAQWIDAVMDWFGFEAGRIGGGKKEQIKKITIATQQSLWSKVKRGNTAWSDDFGCVVGDEIHRWAANTFLRVASVFSGAYRIGASADERRKDGREYLIYETFGEQVYKFNRDELVCSGKLLPVHMQVVKTGYSDPFWLHTQRSNRICIDCGELLETPKVFSNNQKYCSICKRIVQPETPDWVGMIERLTQDDERNQTILRHVDRVLGEDPTNKILILTERVQASKDWIIRLEEKRIPCGLLIGGIENRSEFERTLSGLRTGSVRVAIGTTVADEGLDVPSLTHVFLSCPVHTHPKRIKQMIGRSARPYKQLERGTAVYFWDENLFPPKMDLGFELHDRDQEQKFIRVLKRNCDTFEIFCEKS